MKAKHPVPQLCLLIIATMRLGAHGQEPRWLKHYGNGAMINGLSLAFDGQHDLYGAGSFSYYDLIVDDTTMNLSGGNEIMLIKWDTAGTMQWARSMGGPCPYAVETAGGIIYDTSSGRVLFTGQFDCPTTYFGGHILHGTNNNGRDRFIAVFDAQGDCHWAAGVTIYDNRGIWLLVDAASQVFAFGHERLGNVIFHVTPGVVLQRGGFIAKYGPDGTLIAARRVVVNGGLNRADWAAPDQWVLSGFAKPGATLYGNALDVVSPAQDGFIAKTDTAGAVEWVTMFPSAVESEVISVVALSDGRVAASGYFVENLMLPQDTLYGPPGEWSFFFVLLSAQGEVEWVWVMPQAENLNHIALMKEGLNGDIILMGQHSQPLALGGITLQPYASRSTFVARLSPQGEWLGAWSFGRTAVATGSILPTAHGLYVSTPFDSTLVLGSQVVQPANTGPIIHPRNVLLARFDSLSGFTGIAPKAGLSGQLRIYANPNDGTCTIELPAAVRPGSDLVLTIHDAMGRAVQRVPIAWQQGRVQVDIRAQARGIYHAELLDGATRYTGTIVFQ